jgi:hypothetical protein
MTKLKILHTTEAVIEALGGNGPVGEITGSKPNAVSNWRSWPRFPADTYIVLTAALRQQGFDAPASLWRMKLPAEAS